MCLPGRVYIRVIACDLCRLTQPGAVDPTY